MTRLNHCCPICGHSDLDPRGILVGVMGPLSGSLGYREIVTLKCQGCGWLGEEIPLRKQA
jgi:hypothetical protein